jgi:hypothetical protein
MQRREREVKGELAGIDREWEVYGQLQREKEEIRERARRVINEQERLHLGEIQQFRAHKGKTEGRKRA